jgi:branched-chain amino acid transport system ATP-binding protein
MTPASAAMPATPLLEARGLSAGYHDQAVVRDLAIEVRPGEVVGLLGANGAGKTTTLLALAGELPAMGGEVRLYGSPTRAPLYARAAAGVAFVPEERSVFMQLTVHENLRLGRTGVAAALDLFPELRPLLGRLGGLLSGGEQQMLTLGRALGRGPRVFLGDELSHGLAPLVVRRLLDAVRKAADTSGVGVLLVEQHVQQLARIADRIYVMQRGRIVMSGSSAEVVASFAGIEDAYLTGGDAHGVEAHD